MVMGTMPQQQQPQTLYQVMGYIIVISMMGMMAKMVMKFANEPPQQEKFLAQTSKGINHGKQEEAWKALRWFAWYLEPYIKELGHKIIGICMLGSFARGTQGLRGYDKVVWSVQDTIEGLHPELEAKLGVFKAIADVSRDVDDLFRRLKAKGLNDLAELVKEERYSDIDGLVLIDVDSYFEFRDIWNRLLPQINEGNELVEQIFNLKPFRPEFDVAQGLGTEGEVIRQHGVVEEWS